MGLRVAELFAGVGGFRLGLESAGHEVVWWNQFEPSTRRVQYAYDCYRAWFHAESEPPVEANMDIAKVASHKIAARRPQLLVGGFPCQDYSVMNSLRTANGLRGPKGALWFQIERILNEVEVPYVLLENVPRLLTSGPKREGLGKGHFRGHDFAVILRSLMDLGYAVEWRVLQADEYGFPQRRRRVFIFAAKSTAAFGAEMLAQRDNPFLLTRDGFFAPKFPVSDLDPPADKYMEKPVTVPAMTDGEPFTNEWGAAGVAAAYKARSLALQPSRPTTKARLGNAVAHKRVKSKYYLEAKDVEKWRIAKQARAKTRTVNGFSYIFSEGGLSFPDGLDRSARTILTNEGCRTPNRTTHIIQLNPPHGPYRYLTPEECEELNGFKPGWTAKKPVDRVYDTPDRWRYFMMGNALVVGLVEMMGDRLAEIEGPPEVISRGSELKVRATPPRRA